MQASTKPPNSSGDALQLVDFRIDNFKSLVAFDLPLAKLTCLIGLNGAGKSTVIQALDFASRLFRRHLDGFMDERGWKASDLNSKLVANSNIVLRIEAVRGDKRLVWQGSFNRNRLQCTREMVHINGKRVYRLSDGVITSRLARRPLPRRKRSDGAATGGRAEPLVGLSLCVLEDRSLNDSVRTLPAFDEHLDMLDRIWREELLSSLLANTGRYVFNHVELPLVLKRVGNCLIDQGFFHGYLHIIQLILIRSSIQWSGSGS